MRVTSATRFLPLAAWFAAAWLVLAGGAGAGEGMGALLGEGLKIDGERDLTMSKEHEAIIIRGYPTVTIGDRVKIRARNIVYFTTRQEIYAEGNVEFNDLQDDNAFFCDQMFYNTATLSGEARGVRVRAKIPMQDGGTQKDFLEDRPSTGTDDEGAGMLQDMGNLNRILASARSLRSLNKDHHEGLGVKITTSRFAEPHWHIGARSVVFKPDEKVEMYNAFLKVGRVPVFWFPYIIKDLKYDWPWIRTQMGSTNDWGPYALTKVGMDFDLNPDKYFRLDEMFLDVDYRRDRGWGLGLELRYEMGFRESYGFLDLYGLRESIDDEDDRERAWEENDYPGTDWGANPRWKPRLYDGKTRYSLDWWHWQQLTDRLELLMEAHKYHDRDFRREYFEQAYKNDKEPETTAMLRYIADAWSLEFLGSKRVNDWENQAEYLPELRFAMRDFRLGDLPLYFSNYSSAGWVNYRFDEDEVNLRNLDDQHGSYFRAHTDAKFYSPIRLGEVAVLTPYVGGRATYYGKIRDKAGTGDDGSETNTAVLWGTQLSSTLYGFYGDGKYRHTFTPVVSFDAREDPTYHRDRLYRIDTIEDYAERHTIGYEFRNKLERNKSDFIDLNIRFTQYVDDDERDALNYGRQWSDIHIDSQVRVSDDLKLFANADIDSEDGNFNSLNAGFDWRHRPFRLYVGHQWRRGDYYRAPGADESSETTVALRSYLWNPDTSHYSIEGALTYQWANDGDNEDGLKEVRVSLIRDLDTWNLHLTYFHDVQDDDYGVAVSLSPKAFGGIDRAPDVVVSQQVELEPGMYDTRGAAPFEREDAKPFSAAERDGRLF